MNHCKVYFYVIHWISSWVESSPSFTLLKMSTISYAANTFALEVVANKIWAVKFNCNSNVDSFVVMLNHGHCVWMTDATYITKRCQVPSLIFSPYWIPPDPSQTHLLLSFALTAMVQNRKRCDAINNCSDQFSFVMFVFLFFQSEHLFLSNFERRLFIILWI